MTDDPWYRRREPLPTPIYYVAIAAAFTIAWASLDGNTEAAVEMSRAMATVFLLLAVSEYLIPLASIAGERLGEWWRSRTRGVSP